MAHRAVTSAIVLALAAIGCERSIPSEGDGTLRQLALTGPRGVNDSIATADGRFVVFSTTGPSALLLAADARLSPVARGGYPPDAMAPSDAHADEIVVFRPYPHAFEILSLPKLGQKERIEVLPDIVEEPLAFERFSWLCPTQTGWIAVTMGGQAESVVVAEILRDPLRLGRLGKAETCKATATATDRVSGKLVICGDRTRVEVYDLAKMASVARCDLDIPLDHRVCAGNGTAWIATRAGSILRFDIASAAVTGRTVVAERQAGWSSLQLDLGPSGRLLAASYTGPREQGGHPTVLTVFRIDGLALTAVATARMHLSHAISDLTLLESSETVVVCTPLPVFAWHYGG